MEIPLPLGIHLNTNTMEKKTTVPAGNVLTAELLRKVNREAYQYGGFITKGGIVKKTHATLGAKTTVIIPKKFIKTDLQKFSAAFSKTMNAWYYQLEFI